MLPGRQRLIANILVLTFIVLISAAIGGFVVATYPSWYHSLPFKDSIPASLRPSETQGTFGSKEVVRTVEESAVIEAVDKSSGSVVSIVAKTVNFDPALGVVTDQQGIGTGFVVDSSGIILTNSHVVCDSSVEYNVLTKDGKSLPVKKISSDPANDIGILKIDGANLPALTLGDSDPTVIKIGQKVIAIGNALGQFQNTVTVGVISGIGRGVTASGSCRSQGQQTLNNVIQTDAALNPGNSGGPLLDLAGRVIGINFAVSGSAQNIGFVIPINRVKPILEHYKKEGRIIKPFLGVRYRLIDPQEAAARSVPEGAFVSSVVADSPAASAGVSAGDIVTKLNNEKVTINNDLVSILNELSVGQTVPLEVSRGGKTVSMKITLKEAT
jgi:serine protease Do